MKYSERFNLPVISLLLALFVFPSCATYRSSEGLRLKASPMMESRCPGLADKARAGALAGTVVGTVAGAVFGVPLIGGIYRVAGYVIGFASSDPCRKVDQLEERGELTKKAELAPSGGITEENI